MDILKKIYDEEYYPTKALREIPQTVRDRQWAFFSEIEKTLGVDFIEKHWDSLCKAEEYRDFTNFREGFRLGVSLMLELL